MPKKDAQITKGLGSKLRKVRKDAGLTKDLVAERAEIGPRYLGAIESGTKTPSVEVLFRIVRALGVSADLIAYPERAFSETEEEQLVRLIHTFNERDRRIVKAVVIALLDSKGVQEE